MCNARASGSREHPFGDRIICYGFNCGKGILQDLGRIYVNLRRANSIQHVKGSQDRLFRVCVIRDRKGILRNFQVENKMSFNDDAIVHRRICVNFCFTIITWRGVIIKVGFGLTMNSSKIDLERSCARAIFRGINLGTWIRSFLSLFVHVSRVCTNSNNVRRYVRFKIRSGLFIFEPISRPYIRLSTNDILMSVRLCYVGRCDPTARNMYVSSSIRPCSEVNIRVGSRIVRLMTWNYGMATSKIIIAKNGIGDRFQGGRSSKVLVRATLLGLPIRRHRRRVYFF